MTKALRICAQPGCAELVVSGYCPAHTKPAAPRPAGYYKAYGSAWRKVRDAYLKTHPLCEACGTWACEVDHITPLAQGGTNDWHNLQALCKACHSRKTATHDGGFARHDG